MGVFNTAVYMSIYKKQETICSMIKLMAMEIFFVIWLHMKA